MAVRLRSSSLVLGSAALAFWFTLATFIGSVTTVHAVDCWFAGLEGIGPNCWDEYFSGEYGWPSCGHCANVMCNALGQSSSPPDYQCINSCIAGAAWNGCS